jgi:hypothetical protein
MIYYVYGGLLMSKSADEKIDDFIEELNSADPKRKAKRDDGVLAVLELLDPKQLDGVCKNDSEFRFVIDSEKRRAVIKAQHLLHLVLEEMMDADRLEGTNLDDLRKTADAASKISQLLSDNPTAIAGRSGSADQEEEGTKKPSDKMSDKELEQMLERIQKKKEQFGKNVGPVQLRKVK